MEAPAPCYQFCTLRLLPPQGQWSSPSQLPPHTDALRRDVEELKRKLEDSKKQLQGNEQMIRWLNNQVSERGAGHGLTLQQQ